MTSHIFALYTKKIYVTGCHEWINFKLCDKYSSHFFIIPYKYKNFWKQFKIGRQEMASEYVFPKLMINRI